MTLDPRELIRRTGFSTEEQLRAELAEQQRAGVISRLASSLGPGGMAMYAEALAQVQTTSINYTSLGGPSVSLSVPSGGAFVELYAEAEGNDVGNTGSPCRAGIYEATDLPIAGPDDGTYMEFNTHGAWEIRRLVPGRGGSAQTKLGLGGRSLLWASAGIHSYELRYCHILGNTGQFRNRRLWGRVL